MSELVNLEKRFENALEKLEVALANNITKLEKAAESDAEEIDKLVRELEKVLETDND